MNGTTTTRVWPNRATPFLVATSCVSLCFLAFLELVHPLPWWVYAVPGAAIFGLATAHVRWETTPARKARSIVWSLVALLTLFALYRAPGSPRKPFFRT